MASSPPEELIEQRLIYFRGEKKEERNIERNTSFEWIMRCFHLCSRSPALLSSQKAIDKSPALPAVCMQHRHIGKLYTCYTLCVSASVFIRMNLTGHRQQLLDEFLFFFNISFPVDRPTGELITHLLSSRLCGDGVGLAISTMPA